MAYVGGCLCGAVRYQVAGPLRPVIGCHCGQCRKTSGHHVAATAANREDLLISGEASLTWFQSSPEARRAFCTTCGSQLFWDRAASAQISIFAGSLENADGLETSHHIHAATKGCYYAIGDKVPIWPGDAE